MVVLDGHHSSRATYPPDEPAVVLALVLALLALVPVPVRVDVATEALVDPNAATSTTSTTRTAGTSITRLATPATSNAGRTGNTSSTSTSFFTDETANTHKEARPRPTLSNALNSTKGACKRSRRKCSFSDHRGIQSNSR